VKAFVQISMLQAQDLQYAFFSQ